jgi:hypothetical protein
MKKALHIERYLRIVLTRATYILFDHSTVPYVRQGWFPSKLKTIEILSSWYPSIWRGMATGHMLLVQKFIYSQNSTYRRTPLPVSLSTTLYQEGSTIAAFSP